VYGKQMRVQLNVWQTSTRLWEHASALQPRSIEILGNLAQAYSLALRPKKALATYKKALAMEAMNPVNANQESAELRHMYGAALRQSPSMTDKEFARIQYEKALTLDSMLSETLVSLAWWHEEFKPEDHGAMSLMYYQQAENMALYSLTEEGKLKRKTTGSKTMPHKVLRDASFWLSYG
jgi:tetratricopeptide (TPR) repeat protein